MTESPEGISANRAEAHPRRELQDLLVHDPQDPRRDAGTLAEPHPAALTSSASSASGGPIAGPAPPAERQVPPCLRRGATLRRANRDNPHVFRDTIQALLSGEGISYERLVAAPVARGPPRERAATSRCRGPRAPRGAELVRLRLPDRPGSLAAITGHLAGHGVDVLRLEVLGREDGWAIDDFLVSGAGLRRGARRASARRHGARRRGDSTCSTRARDGLGLRDGYLGVERAARPTATRRRRARARLRRGRLRSASARGTASLRPLASTVPRLPLLDDGRRLAAPSALFSGECLTADGRVPWAPPGYRDLLPGGAVAAIPAARRRSWCSPSPRRPRAVRRRRARPPRGARARRARNAPAARRAAHRKRAPPAAVRFTP